MQRQHVAMHLQQVLLKCLHRLLPNRLKKKPPFSSISSISSGGFFLATENGLEQPAFS